MLISSSRKISSKCWSKRYLSCYMSSSRLCKWSTTLCT